MIRDAGGNAGQNAIVAPVDYKLLYEAAVIKMAEQEIAISSLRKENRELKRRGVPLSNSAYEWLSNLQYKAKALTARVAEFESGEAYTDMKASYKALIEGKDREIRDLKAELADANARCVTIRNNWSQVMDDLEKEHKKELAVKDRETKKQEERALRAERRTDVLMEKLLVKTRELYRVQAALDDEKGKNQKLKSQIRRDHETSSTPSSMAINKKKITNNRERSGKRPGGQPGHAHHPRKWHEPTNVVEIPAPVDYIENPDYEPTGKTVRKQRVDIRVNVIITECCTPEFRDKRSGSRVHAEFPAGFDLDVTYSGSVKAFAFLVNNYCNVSIGKAAELICELTGGKLKLSTGMINGLTAEFSKKTEAEQKRAFVDIQHEPVMNIDFTTARVDGKNVNVAVFATPGGKVLYFAREHKGHKGIKGTPAESYRFTLVHDHDKTYYKYGDAHQECMDHVLRYLKDSMINEKELQWNVQMRDLVREMIHFRKHLDPGDGRDPDKIDPERVAAYEARYDELLRLAKTEYEYVPPGKYYMKGYNLYKRMDEYKASHLLFLHDRGVPYSNSLSERLLRVYKRKQHQVMAFRSFDSLDKLCCALGVIATLREQGKNLYESVAAVFDMPRESAGDTVA